MRQPISITSYFRLLVDWLVARSTTQMMIFFVGGNCQKRIAVVSLEAKRENLACSCLSAQQKRPETSIIGCARFRQSRRYFKMDTWSRVESANLRHSRRLQQRLKRSKSRPSSQYLIRNPSSSIKGSNIPQGTRGICNKKTSCNGK